jgi:membrane protein CcdC involved in cytochrome C biogenesis
MTIPSLDYIMNAGLGLKGVVAAVHHLWQLLIQYRRAISLVVSIVGAVGVLVWRVQETRTAVSARKILIPPIGMATGFCMFFAPPFRVPLTWALVAFLLGALLLAYPLLRTSRLTREGDTVMAQRSFAFFGVIIFLGVIRVAAHGYLDSILTVQQTAGLFFILAFGMIVRWRTVMFLQYRALVREPRSSL